MSDTTRCRVTGTISSTAFPSGDRFAIGSWRSSPLGSFGDVMWAAPDGTRRLLAPTDEVAEFITAIYEFDEIRICAVRVASDGRHTSVTAGDVEIELQGGRLRPLPVPRPTWLTRFVEAPIARRLMGVEAYGVSPTGAREWYQTSGWRWVTNGRGVIDGVDLGRPVEIEQPLRVGFSEPPRRPSIVAVSVAIELPTR